MKRTHYQYGYKRYEQYQQNTQLARYGMGIFVTMLFVVMFMHVLTTI